MCTIRRQVMAPAVACWHCAGGGTVDLSGLYTTVYRRYGAKATTRPLYSTFPRSNLKLINKCFTICISGL